MKNLNLLKITLSLSLTLSLNAIETYTVDDLIVKAMEISPDLSISSSNYEASKSRYDQAYSAYLPQVDVHLSAGQSAMSDIPTNPNEMVDDTIILGRLSLQQIVYDFGKTGGNSDSFKYQADSYSNDYQQLISDKKKDVKVSYYDVLQAIALIKVHEENVKLNRAQLYRSQKYFDAGIKTKIDVSDAKVELIKSNLDLKKAQYDLKLAYTSLNKTVGFETINSQYKVYSHDLDLTNLYDSLKNYDLSLSDSINFAYENKFEIKKQLSQIKVAQANTDTASSDYYPSIYINADYTRQEVNEFKNSLPKDQWQASLNLDWNLYKGGSTDAKEQEKRIEFTIAQSNLQYSRLSIRTLTTQAYLNVQKTKDSVELSQSLLEVSDEKFQQASKRYEHGLSDFIELQQARQGYIDAMATLVVDYYNHYSTIAILDNSIGK